MCWRWRDGLDEKKSRKSEMKSEGLPSLIHDCTARATLVSVMEGRLGGVRVYVCVQVLIKIHLCHLSTPFYLCAW